MGKFLVLGLMVGALLIFSPDKKPEVVAEDYDPVVHEMVKEVRALRRDLIERQQPIIVNTDNIAEAISTVDTRLKEITQHLVVYEEQMDMKFDNMRDELFVQLSNAVVQFANESNQIRLELASVREDQALSDREELELMRLKIARAAHWEKELYELNKGH